MTSETMCFSEKDVRKLTYYLRLAFGKPRHGFKRLVKAAINEKVLEGCKKDLKRVESHRSQELGG